MRRSKAEWGAVSQAWENVAHASVPTQSSVRRLRKLVCCGAPGGAAPYVTGRARRRTGAQRTAFRPLRASRKRPGASRRSIPLALRGRKQGTATPGAAELPGCEALAKAV